MVGGLNKVAVGRLVCWHQIEEEGEREVKRKEIGLLGNEFYELKNDDDMKYTLQ